MIPAPRPAVRVSQRRGGAAEGLGTPLLWFPELAVSVEEEGPPDYWDCKYSRGRSWGNLCHRNIIMECEAHKKQSGKMYGCHANRITSEV